MRKEKHSVFTLIGLLLLACMLVLERFVTDIPDWAVIVMSLAGIACILIGFSKRSGTAK